MNAEKLEAIKNIKNITEKNAERSSEFARFIRDKMIEAGMSHLCGLKLVLVKDNTHGDVEMLGWDNNDDYIRDLTVKSVSNDGDYYYRFGEYRLKTFYPTRDDIVRLSAAAQDIINKLASIANEELKFPDAS